MIIKVLGSGCMKCGKLEEATKKAVQELGIEASVEKVQEMKDIMAYGVLQTPALVVNEQVKVVGKVPSVQELKEILK